MLRTFCVIPKAVNQLSALLDAVRAKGYQPHNRSEHVEFTSSDSFEAVQLALSDVQTIRYLSWQFTEKP